MALLRSPRSPRWYGVPVRVFLITFIGTLLCFAVSLFLGIVGTVAAAALRGVHPDMRVAYRVALPLGIAAGAVIFMSVLVFEIRRYRQMKALAVIERVS